MTLIIKLSYSDLQLQRLLCTKRRPLATSCRLDLILMFHSLLLLLTVMMTVLMITLVSG